jgi:DMSO/TMAO reductase YedYZ heme-binding membrane subunit
MQFDMDSQHWIDKCVILRFTNSNTLAIHQLIDCEDTMRLALGMLTAILVVVLFNKQIRKHPWVFYIAAAALVAIFMITKSMPVPVWVRQYVMVIFQSNTLAMGFFTIVMFTGSFSEGGFLRKSFLPIRAELSIIASILSFSHIVGYGKSYLEQLLTSVSTMPQVRLLATIVAILLVLILIPLFVTSFNAVRKRMSPVLWKRIQRFSYLFYVLIFVHVLFYLLPPVVANSFWPRISLFFYFVITVSYIYMRIRRNRPRRKSLHEQHPAGEAAS